ncbi:MAG: SIR2 family NAD-dependent protein deacylase [Candidatus Kariarchaeaceae archaeon]
MSLQRSIKELAQRVITADRVLFYTGAGISVPSGIPDFRSPGGLWEKYDPFEYATLKAFKNQPAKVWVFLRDLFFTFGNKEPNVAHKALVEIEQLLGREKVYIATQNIDSLHQRAGSTNVFELHGSNDNLHCLSCTFEEPTEEKHFREDPYPTCPKCSYPLKPKVTFFDEGLDRSVFNEVKKIASESELIIGVGSSLEVHPASSIFLSSKNKKAHFNLTQTRYDHLIDNIVLGDAAETLPLFVETLKSLITSSIHLE